ncbi:MAG: hypothetical protein Q8O19_08325, partial [Rectinemataceae bacterium]|nr:hypothetical protein [Rectinemataceae bacterium]
MNKSVSHHHFIIVIPVADRPQHLRRCIDSLFELCQTFGYGGQVDGIWHKISLFIADDSKEPAHIADNRALAHQTSLRGIPTTHFSPDEQFDFVQSLGEEEKVALSRIIGNAKREAFGHKGQGVMRNIAYLKLSAMLSREATQNTLIYSVDSDQEFKVKVADSTGDHEVCTVNFFHDLDAIFSQTDAWVVTGKVVGDPPVSPAVMAGNFLEDVIGFLREIACDNPLCPCQHPQPARQTRREAAYHDMAELFGFGAHDETYRYHCPLVGPLTYGDCFTYFATQLNRFFYGEHPTRISYYQPEDLFHSVQPARTVYAGNYDFRTE